MMGFTLRIHAIMGIGSGSTWKALQSPAMGSLKLIPILKGLEKAGTEDEESRLDSWGARSQKSRALLRDPGLFFLD